MTQRYRRFVERGLVFQPLRPPGPIPHIKDDLAVLTASTQRYYFQWLFDVLPRIHLLEEQGHTRIQLYIAGETRFQRESVALLGIPDERLVHCETIPII